MMIYIVVALLAAIAILGILLLSGSSSTSATTTILPQSNATPIYMSASQAQTLLGSQIINYSANYSASSVYNMSSPSNLTLLESIVPQFSGNVTNGWATSAIGSGPNNASVLYFVIQTPNEINMSQLTAKAFELSFPALPDVTHGLVNGMNYTYQTYANSTGSTQIMSGWKDGYVSIAVIDSNNFTTNQTQMAQVLAGNIQ